jgi:hypothetical protein
MGTKHGCWCYHRATCSCFSPKILRRSKETLCAQGAERTTLNYTAKAELQKIGGNIIFYTGVDQIYSNKGKTTHYFKISKLSHSQMCFLILLFRFIFSYIIYYRFLRRSTGHFIFSIKTFKAKHSDQ